MYAYYLFVMTIIIITFVRHLKLIKYMIRTSTSTTDNITDNFATINKMETNPWNLASSILVVSKMSLVLPWQPPADNNVYFLFSEGMLYVYLLENEVTTTTQYDVIVYSHELKLLSYTVMWWLQWPTITPKSLFHCFSAAVPNMASRCRLFYSPIKSCVRELLFICQQESC